MTRTAALLAVAISFCLGGASSASAAASYVFEPTLSLTGGCTTSLIDEVPDPGPCPGVLGTDHPKTEFSNPNVAIDDYGDIYVSNTIEKEGKVEAKFDVFDANGFFLTEFSDPGATSQGIAVDSKGNFYVFEALEKGGGVVKRFIPTVYEPEKGKIKYEKPPVVAVAEEEDLFLGFAGAIAVDAEDRLYVDRQHDISIFKAPVAEAPNAPENKAAISGLTQSEFMAVDSVHKKIYVSDKKVPTSSVVRVFEMEPPYEELKKDEITGANTPKGEAFVSGEGRLRLDVDDPSGHVFVGDVVAKKIYEFEEDGTYLATIEPKGFEAVPHSNIAVDDGQFSPHSHPEGSLLPEGWLFIPSTRAPSLGHVFAFEAKAPTTPIIEEASVSGITENEATLHALINPHGLPTEYRLEYVTQQQFEEEAGQSFENENATVAGKGTLPAGAEGISVSAAAAGLEPGTLYRFRVFAESKEGGVEAETTFKTFPAGEEGATCENKAFRTGLSAHLPDCRAYELVTPPSTNGRAPSGGFIGYNFPTLRSTADGNLVSFLIEGGALPGTGSAGSFSGDPYLAARGSDGWSSSSAGPNGEEAVGPTQRGLSPDQGYSFWQGVGDPALHIRYPDGHSELIGRGSLGEDPAVKGDLITEGASHIVFTTRAGSAVKLEPNAAPAGTATVYDRPAVGPTHVVSLLPGNEPQKAGEDASYLGASEDGEGIAFSIGGTIYLRLHNQKTFEVAGPGTKFAGVAREGTRVFYLEGGDLFAFDAEAGTEGEAIRFSESGDVTPVNVSSGGTRAYFVSPSALTGEEENPNGEKAKEGHLNLYLSEEGALSFVGIVTKRDVEGESRSDGLVGGLGLWIEAVEEQKPAVDPSRTTPAGATLLFESRANLTEFDSGGFAEVYRYDVTEGRLDCLSCNPTGAPPTGNASLQSISREQFSQEPGSSHLKIANQSPDGKRAFFQTAEPLVLGDTDGKLDVYEWESAGVGSCGKPNGCVYLISGGQGSSPDYLFAMSSSGDDVFFRTADQLLPRDLESTLSIYDARVGGGFAEPSESAPCAAIDTCQPAPTPTPSLPVPGAQTPSEGNVPPKKRCPKGKHRVKRHGKTVCVKKHHKKKHHAGSNKRGATR
jgi:hypothetical protein